MKKRLLSKIPIPEDIPAKWSWLMYHFVVTADEIIIEGVQGLVLNFFLYDDGVFKINFRTFLFPDDYITEVIRSEEGLKGKWRTSALYNEGMLYGRRQVFVNDEDIKKVCLFFNKEYEPFTASATAWELIDDYQESIIANRRNKRYEKEKAMIDKRMAEITDLPKEFHDWVHDEALSDAQYLFYKRIEKNMVDCQCSVCSAKFRISQKEFNPVHKERGVCPKCGKTVTFRAKGRQTRYMRNDVVCTYIEPVEDGLCVRFFNVSRTIERTDACIKEPYDSIHESVREFISYKGEAAHTTCFQYDDFRNTGEIRWCNERGHGLRGHAKEYDVYLGKLYPGNIPKALEKTPLKYSSLEILIKKFPMVNLNYFSFLRCPKACHAIEILIKSGFFELVKDILSSWYDRQSLIDFLGYDLKTVLKLNRKNHPNRNNIRLLREIQANTSHLSVMQMADQIGLTLSKDILLRYVAVFGKDASILTSTEKHASLHKILRFFEELHCKEKKTYDDLTKDWYDYLSWCKKLRIAIHDEYNYLPPDFYRRHDYVYHEYMAQMEQEENARRAARDRKLKKQLRILEQTVQDALKNHPDIMRHGRFVIVAPHNANEIKKEGEVLHHCVATYIDRVTDGRTTILFVRKKEEPDKPFYTLEFYNGKVYQCRGLYNSSMTEDVQKFVNAFEQSMREQIRLKPVS